VLSQVGFAKMDAELVRQLAEELRNEWRLASGFLRCYLAMRRIGVLDDSDGRSEAGGTSCFLAVGMGEGIYVRRPWEGQLFSIVV